MSDQAPADRARAAAAAARTAADEAVAWAEAAEVAAEKESERSGLDHASVDLDDGRGHQCGGPIDDEEELSDDGSAGPL